MSCFADASLTTRLLLLAVLAAVVFTSCASEDETYTNALPGSIVVLRTIPLDGESFIEFTEFRSELGRCLGAEVESGVRTTCSVGDDGLDVPISGQVVDSGLFLAYGLVVSDHEVAVEFHLVDSSVIQKSIDSNGFYAWTVPNRQYIEISELRFLDAQGIVVRTQAPTEVAEDIRRGR